MPLLIIFLTIFFLLILKLEKDKISRTILSFVVVYLSVPLFISTLNPFGMYEVSFPTYLLLILSVFCLIIGAITYQGRGKAKYVGIIGELSYDWMLKSKVVKICFICSFLLLAYLAITQWRVVLFLGGAGPLKINFFELVFNNNSVLFFIYKVIASPFFFLSLILASIMIIEKKPHHFISIFIGINIILFCFVGGKRGYYATSITYLAICLVILHYTSNNKIDIKDLLKFAIVGVIFILAAVITTLSYTGLDIDKEVVEETGGNVIEQLVTYNVGSFRLLDYALVNDWVDKTPMLCGRATLGGCVDYYGCAILQRLGFNVQQASEIGMEQLQNNFISISNDNEMNYAFTSLIYFLFDFGIIGVILFSFLFGRFLNYSIVLYSNSKTIGSLLLMMFVLNGALSMWGSWFNGALYTQPLIIIAFWLHKRELKYRNLKQ